VRWPVLAAIVTLALTGEALAASKADRDTCGRRGDPDQRIRACTRVVEDTGETVRNRAIAINWRGVVRREQGNNDAAIADYEEAMRIDPAYAPPYNNRGNILRARGNLDRALADYTKAISLNPKFALAWSNRGFALLDRRQYEKAMDDCDEAINLAPKAAHGYACRGGAYGASGDNDASLEDCEEAVRLDPRYASGFNCRGLARMRDSDYDGAIADLTEAIRLTPRFAVAYNNRGRNWMSKGDPDRAIADFSEAIRINPTFRAAYRNRGNAYTAKGDNARAAADYAAAKRSDRQTAAPEPAPVTRSEAPPAPPAAKAAPAKTASANTVPAKTAATAPASTRPAAARPQKAGRRVALVIGNAAYKAVPALINPMRDAQSVATALRSIGFSTVTTSNDATRAEMVNALRQFEDEAEKAEWAVIYFAGHGVEYNGVNYLIPVDASLKSDRDLQDEAVPLDRVLSSVENARKLRLVILDACRDNPFVQMRRSVATRSLGRGLGSVEPDSGVLVAYAAKHGQVALDGEGGMSPFASALVKRLATPNLEISMLFRMVRDDVLNATAKKQEPFVYGSLPGEALYFVQK
jgi:tetratricopeptide (TPR) repeat protein